MTFHFRPVLTLFAALGFAVLIALGVWQLQRREWKLDLIERAEARLAAEPISFDDAVARAAAGEDMEYQPIFVSGVYAHDLEAPVFGTLGGDPGAYIFTPLDAPGSDGGRRFIYVNRGFVPQRLIALETRAEGDVKGEATVRGLFRSAEHPASFAKMFRPADQPEQNLWFTRDPERLAARHNIETVPYYIDSSGAENPAARPKGGTTQLDFFNRHLEYALTWFALAAVLAGVYLAFSLKRR
jgi:surfeit locus 1 family protein